MPTEKEREQAFYNFFNEKKGYLINKIIQNVKFLKVFNISSWNLPKWTENFQERSD